MDTPARHMSKIAGDSKRILVSFIFYLLQFPKFKEGRIFPNTCRNFEVKLMKRQLSSKKSLLVVIHKACSQNPGMPQRILVLSKGTQFASISFGLWQLWQCLVLDEGFFPFNFSPRRAIMWRVAELGESIPYALTQPKVDSYKGAWTTWLLAGKSHSSSFLWEFSGSYDLRVKKTSFQLRLFRENQAS